MRHQFYLVTHFVFEYGTPVRAYGTYGPCGTQRPYGSRVNGKLVLPLRPHHMRDVRADGNFSPLWIVRQSHTWATIDLYQSSETEGEGKQGKCTSGGYSLRDHEAVDPSRSAYVRLPCLPYRYLRTYRRPNPYLRYHLRRKT